MHRWKKQVCCQLTASAPGSWCEANSAIGSSLGEYYSACSLMFKKVVVIFGGRQGDRILELARRGPQDIGHFFSSLWWLSFCRGLRSRAGVRSFCSPLRAVSNRPCLSVIQVRGKGNCWSFLRPQKFLTLALLLPIREDPQSQTIHTFRP